VIQDEVQIIKQLQEGDIDAYEVVYKAYFQPLYHYARTIVDNDTKAEDIVQNMFIKIWEKSTTMDIQTSLKAYLYKSVYNASLNALKSNQVEQKVKDQVTHHLDSSEAPLQQWDRNNLEKRLSQALKELPEQCRTVFQMSRFEQLKYREIADQLGISTKTVEQHMTKALKSLRLQLIDYLVAGIMVYFTFNSVLS
jgi:RNA polymerase sigma-70 factor, ECF subfamily